MKYIAVSEQGDLLFKEHAQPPIDEHKCLIKVKAIGVNRADILQRQGKYPPPKGESDVLGIEVAGEVVQAPQNCAVNVGERVCAIVAGGGYAEYVSVDINHLIPIPQQFSFEQGAALAETFLTAYQSLIAIAQLKVNEKVLIHAGASGVGTAAIQLAKALGCYVVATTSNELKAKSCCELGADQTINYKTQCFVDWKKEHLPKGFDVIVDVVAGDYLNKNIECLALDGRIVILSMLNGRYSEPVDIAKLLLKRANIHASTLRNRSDAYKSQLVSNFINDFYHQLNNDQIAPVIDKVISWQEANQAHELLIANKNIGKVILIVD